MVFMHTYAFMYAEPKLHALVSKWNECVDSQVENKDMRTELIHDYGPRNRTDKRMRNRGVEKGGGGGEGGV